MTNNDELDEIFLPIKGYRGFYEISNSGKVRSSARGPIRMLKVRPRNSKVPYLTVQLKDGAKNCTFYMHRLVAQAFVPNPNNYPEVNHVDGDKLNNWADNLEWCTHQMNIDHSMKTGLYTQFGENNTQSKLTEQKVREIRALKGKYSLSQLGKMYGVSFSNIGLILNNKAWKHVKAQLTSADKEDA